MLKKLPLWMLTLAVGSGLMLTGCSDDDDDDGGGGTDPIVVDEFATTRMALNDYVSDTDTPPVITAAAVFELMDDEPADAPFILSVRSAEHYAAGHVPGAINIPWKTVTDPDNLAMLPTDGRQIIVYCYTGHTGGVATTVLAALGYNTINMKHGMSAWNTDYMGGVGHFTDPATSYPTVTAVTNPSTRYDLPALENTSSSDLEEIVRMAAHAHLTDPDLAPIKPASTIYGWMTDEDETNDPFIVSVRAADAYALGHIEGAINIPWRTITDVEQLQRIDPDKKIVIYCYTGHTGGVATTALNMLGYDAVNMKFGMCGWTTNETVRATTPYSPPATNYDVETSE